jgi:L-histidine N-alpha-methyltransferase
MLICGSSRPGPTPCARRPSHDRTRRSEYGDDRSDHGGGRLSTARSLALHLSGLPPRARRRPRGGPLSPERGELLAEIRAGLGQPQKELPSKLFYDERGSELFEEITRQPEYYLTRAEHALLQRNVAGYVAALRPRSLVELGAGSAAKTRLLLDAMRADGRGEVYVPVDISAEFLERTATALRSEYPELEVAPVAADFTRSLALSTSLPRPALLTFLGSTIGNFTADQAVGLLRHVRATMRSGDRFLLGVDLRKDVAMLEAAYNDAAGVTAEFDLNLLRVVNRRFGADFDLQGFRHRAIYDAREHRMEMHLVSMRPQSVHIPGAGDYALSQGETIRTEISCKYDRRSVEEMFVRAGLDLAEWREDAGGLFALCLGTPAGEGG